MRTTILILLTVLAVATIFIARARMRAERRSHERDGLAQFIAAFREMSLPPVLLEQTYRYLVERREAVGEHENEHFIVAPGHDLGVVYHFHGLDVEDAVLVIADRGGAQLPRATDLDGIQEQVRTVRDLIEFLAPYYEQHNGS